MEKIGLGGGCHWCTEGVFQSVKGISKVDQGWIQSKGEYQNESEAVIVDFDPLEISLYEIIKIHLQTHACTSNHSMREKYRSAIYTFNENQAKLAELILKKLASDFDERIITRVLQYSFFRLNEERFLNYYQNNPEAPFCKTYIRPKLELLQDRFKNVLIKDLKG